MTIRRRIALLLIAMMTVVGLTNIATSAQAVAPDSTISAQAVTAPEAVTAPDLATVVTGGNNLWNSYLTYPGLTIDYSYWYDGHVWWDSDGLSTSQSNRSEYHYNVQCFTPEIDAQNVNTGYIYAGGVMRCFTTNYNDLILVMPPRY